MKNWDDKARLLIELARDAHEPNAADRARIAAAFAARCALDPTLVAAQSATSIIKVKTVGLGVAKFIGVKLMAAPAWVAFGIAASGGVATGVVVFRDVEKPPQHARAPTNSRAPNRPTPAPRSSAPVAESPINPVEPNAEAPAVAHTKSMASNSPSSKRVTTSSPESASSARARPTADAGSAPGPWPGGLDVELQGLRQAQQLLHGGDARRALLALDGLDRAHAVGVLREEREATRAIALCTLGRTPGSRVLEFEKRFPASVHLERVRTACTPREDSTNAPTDPSRLRH